MAEPDHHEQAGLSARAAIARITVDPGASSRVMRRDRETFSGSQRVVDEKHPRRRPSAELDGSSSTVADLLIRAGGGDEAAWSVIVARFAGLVWSVARSFRLSPASTDDVVQTVWLRLAEHCTRIREPERLASWLATTTRHEALRVARGHQRFVPRDDFAEASEPTDRSIEDIITDDVTLQAVLVAFDRLAPADQQLLRLLCTMPPLDYQTIATIIGRSVGSIGPSRARCLDKLRRLLPAGIDPKAGAR